MDDLQPKLWVQLFLQTLGLIPKSFLISTEGPFWITSYMLDTHHVEVLVQATQLNTP